MRTHRGATALHVVAGSGRHQRTRANSNAQRTLQRDILLDVEARVQEQCQQVSVVELLARQGADLDSADDNGNTPLLVAAKRGQCSVCSVLVELGCNLHVTNNAGVSE
jgi:ankyrin repeat protein